MQKSKHRNCLPLCCISNGDTFTMRLKHSFCHSNVNVEEGRKKKNVPSTAIVGFGLLYISIDTHTNVKYFAQMIFALNLNTAFFFCMFVWVAVVLFFLALHPIRNCMFSIIHFSPILFFNNKLGNKVLRFSRKIVTFWVELTRFTMDSSFHGFP